MSRAALPTQAVVARYVKALRKAGEDRAEVRIEPNGTVRILLGDAAAGPDDGPNPWDAALQ